MEAVVTGFPLWFNHHMLILVLLPATITLGIGLVAGWIMRGLWDEEQTIDLRERGTRTFFAPPSHVRRIPMKQERTK
jgi:hypothetical protein